MERSGDIVSKLIEKGYRLTPQRMMVLAAIENSANHISAEEIYAQVIDKYPYVTISTVYRTLQLMKRLGQVTETDLWGKSVFLREYKFSADLRHLAIFGRCVKCSK